VLRGDGGHLLKKRPKDRTEAYRVAFPGRKGPCISATIGAAGSREKDTLGKCCRGHEHVSYFSLSELKLENPSSVFLLLSLASKASVRVAHRERMRVKPAQKLTGGGARPRVEGKRILTLYPASPWEQIGLP